MPLLNKVPFERQVIRQNLKDDEKVFYCSVTDEIFENYEEFCDRVLLVNSVIWTCAYTGKTHMTFEEAAASEEHSRSLLKDFPVELRIPALYLASLTQRTSLENLAEDVFSFAKERYFVGESVEVNFKGDIWCESHVIQVIEPAKKENNVEDNSGSRFSGCLPASVFRYEVDAYEQDDSVEHIVKATHIRRKKGVFTRDRNRLYLKQFAEPEPSGIWKIKNEALQKYGIPRVKFENIFVGRHPVFQASKNIRKPQAGKSKQKQTVVNGKQTSQNNKKEKRQESIEKYLTVSTNHNNKKTPTKADGKKVVAAAPTPQKQVAQKVKEKYRNTGGVTKKKSTNHMVMSVEKLKLLREQQKEHARELRRKRGIERGIERAKVKEEKRRLDEFMKRWNQPREDLECEDLKLLPTPVPVQSRIPNEHFGDFLMILEFFHNFSEALSMKESFPHGITFDLVERALSEKEVAGPFSDIMQFLLMTLFNMQEEEDDEVSSDSTQVADLVINERTDVTTSEAIRLATAAASWSQQYQGTPMNKLPLDAVTLTEVLRLHLLSSGGRCGDVNAKWRYQQRGGYTSRDDPGLLLRMQSPHILRALGVMSIFDLPLGDKLIIITCLINQILTYAAFRDVIDERCETYRVQRIELKVQQLSVMKKEKELAVLKIKQRKDAKVKPKGEAAPAGVEAEAGAVKSSPPLEDPETEAQLAERIAKLEKELARSQADYQRKASQLKTIAVGHRVVPLGTDRAHRRFWTFNSCPGLFVEHDPVEVGPCLPAATPHDPTLECTKDTILYVRRLFEEEQSGSGGNNGGSDKENDSHDDKKRTPKKPTATAAAAVAVKTEAGGVADAAALLMICTADERCTVHGDGPKTRWAFYAREDDVNALVEGLSTRGVREAELRQSLVDEHQKIVQALPRCPAHKLNTVVEAETAFTEDRKSVRGSYNARYNEANLNFPPGTPADEIFELSLRDMILDLEEKSHCGGLGTLKVYNREAWRNAISARSYDKQCSHLQFGVQNPIESPENIPIVKTSGRTSGRGSRSGTPSIDAEAPRKKPKMESVEYKDPGRLLGAPEMKHNPVVTDLASAILQVGQSLEKKYRQKPLVFKGDDWSQIERWELSLMASTNLSQLFIHYYTLESSIQWSKSALNANCRLCRRRGDPENMLLCDNCNKGHHLYCLKPKLTKVPTGDWFCPKCRPQVKTPRAERKRRSIFVPEEDEVEEEVEADESVTEEEAEEDEEVEPPFYEVCDTCGEGGEVICCDTESCILVYHIECLVPPLKKVPRGKWYCPKCKAVPLPSTTQARASKDGDGEWQPKEQSPPVNRNRRGCAAAAVAKISKFAKQIRSRSWENNDSDGGLDANSDELQPSRRSARMSLEPDLDLPLNNALLQDLLTEVMHHKDAWPFLRPVVRAQVPDYHLIIKRPMDLGTMKNKLNMLNYTNNSEFIADANLVFENCKMYNQYDAQEYKCGIRLRKFFEKRCKELGLHTAFEEDEDDEEPPKKKSRSDDK